MAGIKNSSSNLSTALESINKNAEEAKREAEAAKLRTEAYRKMSTSSKPPEETNRLIAEAMAKPTASVDDRLSKYLK
jgi:hypothetical protein